jgi:DNA polymerase I-like protein with 3'-5' exonuclease and polymerase domains
VSDLSDVTLHLVDSLDEALEMRRWLGERREVMAVDTETTGLEVNGKDVVRLIQFGDANAGWAVPWDRWSGIAVDVLQRYEERIVFHNAKFDVSFIEKCAPEVTFDWRRVDDTRSAAWLLDPTRPTGLKQLAARYVDARAAGMQSQLDDAKTAQGWTWETTPVTFGPYWQYAALDTVLTAKLWETVYPRLDEAAKRAYELECQVLPVLMHMERKGAHVDPAFAAGKYDELTSHVRDCQAWAKDTHGVSLTANQQCVRRLQEMGVTLTQTTKSGQHYALDKDVVDGLLFASAEAGRSDIVEFLTVMRRARQYGKIAGTYVTHLMSAGDRIHASINPIGAPKTGRMSISGPSLQNLPRADENNPAAIAVRDCFTAAPGHSLCMVDFDQIELRLMAHFSQDATMIEVLSEVGLDPFTAFAQRIYDDDTIVKKDPRRQLTKNAAYAKAYGAGKEKFALTAGVSLEQGSVFLDTFDAQFPGVLSFQRYVDSVANQRYRDEGEAYVRTPYGHHLAVTDHNKAYALVNYLIQGTAANVMKAKLVQLDAAGFGEYMVLPVHDEVILELPDDGARAIADEVGRVMSDLTTFAVPLPAGVDGPFERWGDKYR